MTDILLVVDSFNWGSHHAARAVADILRGRINIGITDIAGLTRIDDFNYDLIMCWLDSAEEPVHDICEKHKIPMASRIGGWKGIYRTCLLPPKIHERIKGVVCCSHEIQLSAKKVYPRNVVAIMNGVNTNIFKPAKEYAHEGRWLWIGRTHDEQKDYGLLQSVDKKYKRKIDVIGQKRVSGKVVPTGWPQEMVKNYQNAKGFLRTSRNEGSSNCLLEAMSCGIPVVATPTGIAPRLLDPRCLATSTKHIVRTMRRFDDRRYAETNGTVNRTQIINGWQWEFRREPYLEFFEKCMDK